MKILKTNEEGWAHFLVPLVVIAVVAFIGVRVLTNSHAANLNTLSSDVKLGEASFNSNPNRSIGAKKALESQQAQSDTTAGIVPPQNPSQSLPPNPNFSNTCPWNQNIDTTTCNTTILSAVNNARTVLESLHSMSLNLTAYENLTTPQQIFVITNIERVDRGLTPVVALTNQLDTVAQSGITNSTDPYLNGWTLTGGTQVYSWGSNWAGGTTNALGSDYYWMYDDGYPSSNGDCTSQNSPGCWGHRDNVLGTFITTGQCSSNPNTYMGTGYNISSYDEILVGGCGAVPTDEVFTWQQALALLNGSGTGTNPVNSPSVPTGVSAKANSSTSVTVSWVGSTDSGGPGLAGYQVYRNGSLVTNSTTTSYIDNSVSSNTSYSYTVAAYDKATPPNVSAQSAPAAVTTPPVTTTTNLPTAPLNVKAVRSTPYHNGVTVSWQAPSSNGGSAIRYYKVYRGTSSGHETLMGTYNCTNSTCVWYNTGTSSGTIYYYKLAAVNSAGVGPLSSEVSATAQ
jgi:hypothetical protein